VGIAGSQMNQLSDAERGRLRNRAVGFVYQFHHLLPEFTALENVAMPLLVRRMAQGRAAQAPCWQVGLAERSIMSRSPAGSWPGRSVLDEPTGNPSHALGGDRHASAPLDRVLPADLVDAGGPLELRAGQMTNRHRQSRRAINAPRRCSNR
jgi:ABC-type sugar transport system ATPase subunit